MVMGLPDRVERECMGFSVWLLWLLCVLRVVVVCRIDVFCLFAFVLRLIG